MKKTFKLTDLDCAVCAAKLEDAVRTLDGIDSVSVSFMAQTMTIETSRNIDEIMPEVVRLAAKIEPDCEIILK
ncbi:MAG: heavy metal-associated domain-containing protein [Pseudomonadota bacterium]|nr:heavy metal-associated domain-containing protein [Pseudomonadota bacterium]